MKVRKMFGLARGKLGDTNPPYRNTDQDLINGLDECIDYLWIFRKDLFLDDNMKMSNDYEEAEAREPSHDYSVGDMIYVNDPLELYYCTIAGTSDADTPYVGEFVTDGTAMFSRFTFNESINLLFVSHYIAYHCLMLDADEQANEQLAQTHYSTFLGGI